jgi:hypothetical protein
MSRKMSDQASGDFQGRGKSRWRPDNSFLVPANGMLSASVVLGHR